MKHPGVAFVVLAWSATVVAFEGQVVRPGGEPIPDATVSLLGQPGSARTNENGFFAWTPNPKLPFEVLVVLPGGQYMAPVLVEMWPADGPVLIEVQPLVNESITVTASTTPNIEAPPASGMSVVPLEVIEQRHPLRLTEVVENIPGTGQLSDLHNAVPSIRGLARGRTLILIDGARVTTERRAGPSATYLDPFFLEGVEVSRGPGSVAYGSDAFGGVIHARTSHAEPGSPLHIRLRGSLGAGLPEQSAGVELTQGLEEGGLVFQARYRNFDAYDSPEGEVTNSQASDRGFLGRFGHEVGPGYLNVSWQTDQGRDIGRPDIRTTRLTSYPTEDSNRLSLAYDLDPQWGFTRMGLTGFLGNYGLLTEQNNLPTATKPRTVAIADVTADDFGLRGTAARSLGSARLEMGVDVNGRFDLHAIDKSLAYNMDDDLVATVEQVSVEQASRTDTGVYATAEVPFGERFSGSGGLRFDHVGTQNQGGYFGDHSTSNESLSGFASLRAEITRGLSLTGQVARGFRDPMLSDRYFRGVSGRGVVTGNPDLQPETALQYDLALRYVRSGFRWAVYGYHYRIDDLIERYEDGTDRFFFRNRGRAVLRGVELEIQGDVGQAWTYELGANWTDGKAVDDDQPLDDIPPQSVTLQLSRYFTSSSYVRMRFALFGRDEESGPTEITTPGYGTLDAGAGWRFHPHFQVRVLGRNLLDKDYPVSPDEFATLAPGIHVVATLIAEF